MATVNQTVPFTISPKDAAGNAVDLAQFPTALSGISWSVDQNATVVAAADGLSAVVTPTAAGTVNVTVAATNVAGTALSETVSVVFDAVVPVVVTLNPVAGTPVDQVVVTA